MQGQNVLGYSNNFEKDKDFIFGANSMINSIAGILKTTKDKGL